MEEDTTKTIVIFTINGINALLGWNAVLAALDFFQGRFNDYNIYSYLPIPVFLGYVLVGSTFHIISNKYTYSRLIVVGNMGINISLIFMLLTSLYVDQSLLGFILLLFGSFLCGVSSNCSQLSFFSMINYLSESVVSKFTVGTAVSGLLITGIRAIILAIAGPNNDSVIPIIIYFILAILFNTMDMFMNITFCKSSVYKHKIDKFLLHHDKQKDHETNEQTKKDSQITNRDSINPDQQSEKDQQPVDQKYVQEQNRIENQSYFKTLYETFHKLSTYPLIIMFTFVITFMLFPGPSLHKSFGDRLDPAISSVFILLSYNIGDTAGKYIVQIKNFFNPKSLLFLFFARLYFFLPITVMATGADQSDELINNLFFPFLNQFLLAFSNGICINASFIMAFKICPLQYKKYAGVLCGLILQIGIMIGTFLQIPYSYIIGIN